ncbi:peptidase family C50-domain-containing protein [Coniella lustricola]|uniref:separase n=1 Tax=Coniella lustricola TaxID=2025994 RepID=A0A2T2ZSS7_9PEZI|nr:peptidase family C50-domain-containing protein [Coniella lustricola]
MSSANELTAEVQRAVASIETCTPATTAVLKELLLPKDTSDAKPPRTPRVPARSTAELSAKDKAMLATHVVNASLKSLGEAVRSHQTQVTVARTKSTAVGATDATTMTTTTTTTTTAMAPMKSRDPNQIPTSPDASKKNPKPSARSIPTECIPTIECSRLAFASLRHLQAGGKITLPALQLEGGMSSFIGKLLSLCLYEYAIKELRILKRRLSDILAGTPHKIARAVSNAPSLSEILDYGNVDVTSPAFDLVFMTQLQVLKIMSKANKPADIEAALPTLRSSHPSSPTNLLLRWVEGKGKQDQTTAARNLDTISQLLFVLVPGIATTDDDEALEPTRSMLPLPALEIQTLALHARLSSWKLAQKKDVDKDIMLPLSKSIAACIRRSAAPSAGLYKACQLAFNSTCEEISRQDLQCARNLRSPLASIYQSLGKLARDLGQYSEAINWLQKSIEGVDKSQDSIAKRLSTITLLLACQLRVPCAYPSLDALCKEVLEGFMGPLRGDSTELDDLLESAVMVRRSAMHIFVGNIVDDKGTKFQPSASVAESLEAFILQLPRFCLRWLGKRPADDQSNNVQRFEQRRDMLAESVPQILDSVLIVLKTSIDAKKSVWEKLDAPLVESISLLDSLAGLPCADASSQHYFKISHIYYLQHNQMYALEPKPVKNGTIFPYALKALKRSIDCIKDRSKRERDKGHWLYKVERINQMYKAAGKPDHALTALQTVRDGLIGDGVLTTVAEALRAAPPRKVWAMASEVQSLAWAINAVARMKPVWEDWTAGLDELERVAALEYSFGYALSTANTYVGLADPLVANLLEMCRADRFPVRRLRILLQLLIANIGNAACVEEIQEQVEKAAWINEDMILAEDAGLRHTIPCIKALAASIIALSRAKPDHQQLAASIAAWRSIIDSVQDPADLAQRFDDIPALLEHLQSVADFARLSNHNALMSDALQLAADLMSRSSAATDPTLALQVSAALALQLTNAGQSTKAATVLEQAVQYAQASASVTEEEVVRFLLSYAEYFIEIGAVERAEELVYQAKTAGSNIQASSRSKTHKVTMAHVSLLYSAVALGRGDAPCALTHARNATRILFQEWARLEQTIRSKENKYAAAGGNSNTNGSSSNNSTAAASTCSITTGDTTMMDATTDNKDAKKPEPPKPTMSGPEAWKLAYPVIMGLLCLSNIYAHLGIYQETLYYAEQAQLIAQTADSAAYLAECESWLALIAARANKLDDALSSAGKVEARLDRAEYSARLVSLYCRLSVIYREAQDFEREKGMLDAAETMVDRMAGGVVAKKIAATSRKAQAQSGKGRGAKAAAEKTFASAAVTAPVRMQTEHEDAHLAAIKAAVLVEKASSMVHQKDWAGALELLQEARPSTKLVPSLLGELLAAARSLLGQSVEEMAQDAVCSVIQESPLSFPSVGTTTSDKRDRFSMITASPGQALLMSPNANRDVTATTTQSYLQDLRQARDYLLEAHALASTMGDGKQVHDILCTLQNVVILLSAASSSSASSSSSSTSRSKAAILGHPGYATCSVEMARNLTWRREMKALHAEKNSGKGGMEWPEELRPLETRRISLSPIVEITQFQREYIDIIPPEWSVISMSLSDNKRDLCVSKLQAGQSPFVIRLPLVEKASGSSSGSKQDAVMGGAAAAAAAADEDGDDEAKLSFDQGHKALLDFIQRANATCHDQRDFSVKGAKTAWWNERTALDVELKDLMEKIESCWFGGFKGIFSPHQHQHQHQRQDGGSRYLELVEKFRAMLEAILDKHLPSRRQVARGKKTVGCGAAAPSAAGPPLPKIKLDTRILDLFIGLGDGRGHDAGSGTESGGTTTAAAHLYEPLSDLLYFVVDILQFNGERNAYDEIDFDAMIVETADALHAYHVEIKEGTVATDADKDKSSSQRNRQHTILILDKVLHTFPWESMPVLQPVAVSRVPSLACLKRLLMEQQASTLVGNKDGSKRGHHVSIRNGTYILNPGNDLKTTQDFFAGPLESSLLGSTWSTATASTSSTAQPSSWKRIQGKAPSEADFESALTTSDMVLYMGHGGGSQYIRTRTVRRLEKCRATTLLMGCSSASLNDVGGFEVYGLVWSYMLAGCPAVVGTLWDVTDKDIDLFTGKLYEEWGVVGRGVFEKRAVEAAAAAAKVVAAGGKKDEKKDDEKGAAKRTRSVSRKRTAIARAKNGGVCKFKYLNAGAVCVYGIPVYIERGD